MSTEMTQQTKVEFLWMSRAHMDAVLNIEQRCFEYPETLQEFHLTLRCRNCIGMVSVNPNDLSDVWGYAVYQLHKNQVNILNLAVDPNFHRQGIGSAMVEKLTRKLGDKRRRLDVMVREYALDAQLFYKAQGFRWIGTWKDYYDSGESAYQMRYAL